MSAGLQVADVVDKSAFQSLSPLTYAGQTAKDLLHPLLPAQILPENHLTDRETMSRLPKSDDALETRIAANLLEALIRAGLILILAIICYQVFSPFMILMAWAVILAVTLYPLHQRIARRVGGRQGIASTFLLIVGFVLIAVP